MADWEEIKRLAADFQRTQTSDTLQRISERNCIDIVKKLTDLKLIDLIYTCDGKEFITPNHLLKEIEDEVYVNGGRVHLHDLAASLNVDYQHVENISKTLAIERPEEYNLILGQIIHSTYKSTLEKQIYDTMVTTGQLSIADFAKTLDLPSEFLSTVVKELLPRVMDDFVISQDERTYYTADMMDRYRSIIVGTLTAITKPTNIVPIMKRLDIPDRLFTSIVDGLMKENRIDAHVENRIYIPAVYAREQSEWVDKFYKANSYIEYDMLSRMDIKQPKAFLKKRFPDGVQLKTCYISPALIMQVESMLDDCIATNGLIDVTTIVPPSFQAEDIDQLLHDIFKRNRQFNSSCLIVNQTNVCALGFIATCKKSLSDMMESKAQQHLKDGKLINHFLGGELPAKKSKISNNQSDSKESNETSLDKIGENPKVEQTHTPDMSEQPKDKDSGDSKAKVANIELTAEDIKRERRQKKNKGVAEVVDDQDSDEDHPSGKKSKGSRKSGGGAQGREIKQKAVKKKYLPGSKGKNNDDSDHETPNPKGSKSNKGRAARRAISPDRSSSGPIKGGKKIEKAPLVFLNDNELVNKLKEQSRDYSGDFPDGVYRSIANMLENDLNKAYEILAKRVLDDFLKSSMGQDEDESCNEETEAIELIE